MATMRITVASRNGNVVLPQVIGELATLRQEAPFRAVLSRDEVDDSTSDCVLAARADPSGHLYDLAECVQAWPALDKAHPSEMFTQRFRREVLVHGVDAFPAIRVVPFEFPLRMNKLQFNAAKWDVFREPENGKLEPSPSFRRLLCDRAVTFIDPDLCKIRVVPRLDPAHTDIYVTQTGYQIHLINPMPLDVATALGKRLNQRFEATREKVPGSVTISIFRRETGLQQQSPAGSANPPALGTNITELWAAMGTGPEALTLFGPADPPPPAILVFDKLKVSNPLLIRRWFDDFTSRAVAAPSADCPAEQDEVGHSNAVASVLFPASIVRHLSGAAEGTAGHDAGAPPMGWDGFFLSTEHFSGGLPAFDDQEWWRAGFLGPGQPVVALVVYGSEYESPEMNAARTAAEQYLGDKSNLLVISAPQKRRNGQKQNFAASPLEPTDDPDEIESYCFGQAWPACLGRHPRVLVVASSDYPSVAGGRPTLLLPNDYVLGASTVRLAAPGGNIPVARGCHSDTSDTWRVATANGTSFAAPIVALVLSRLVQLGKLSGDQRVTPEAAIWRILATAKPLDKLTPAGTPNVATQFGELDAGRALKGASTAESGEQNNAVLYEKNATDTETVSLAVVMPFPWNDNPETTDRYKKFKHGIEAETRSVIAFQAVENNDTVGPTEHVEFDRMIRIVRRPNDQLADVPLFDIFYVERPKPIPGSKRSTPNYVVTRPRVRLGAGTNPNVPGFCRSDAVLKPAQRGTPGDYQSQASCLYAWRAGTAQFERLDLASVTDIVFPLLHLLSNFPARINPTDLVAVTRPSSPWHDVFCDTLPRRQVTKLLIETYQQKNPEALCPR
jgi:hypothetical protein